MRSTPRRPATTPPTPASTPSLHAPGTASVSAGKAALLPMCRQRGVQHNPCPGPPLAPPRQARPGCTLPLVFRGVLLLCLSFPQYKGVVLPVVLPCPRPPPGQARPGQGAAQWPQSSIPLPVLSHPWLIMKGRAVQIGFTY